MMGETIPCPACGGPVYDSGTGDAGDLVEMHGCQRDDPSELAQDDDSASGPPFSAVIDRSDYDPAWEPNEGDD